MKKQCSCECYAGYSMECLTAIDSKTLQHCFFTEWLTIHANYDVRFTAAAYIFPNAAFSCYPYLIFEYDGHTVEKRCMWYFDECGISKAVLHIWRHSSL
jgi:hypothetical protein